MVMFTKDGEDDSEKRPTEPEDAKHPYNRAERWGSACDTVAQLYVDVRYDPAKDVYKRQRFGKTPRLPDSVVTTPKI